jgi:acyl dehydratase
MVRRWLGPTGWMARVSLQFRAPNVAGETLTAWGSVTALEEAGRYGLVHCDVGIRNQDGVESSPGTATCVLPLDPQARVPYPFPGLEQLS